VAGDTGRGRQRQRCGRAGCHDAPLRAGELAQPWAERVGQFVEINERFGCRRACGEDVAAWIASAVNRAHADAIDERFDAELAKDPAGLVVPCCDGGRCGRWFRECAHERPRSARIEERVTAPTVMTTYIPARAAGMRTGATCNTARTKKAALATR